LLQSKLPLARPRHRHPKDAGDKSAILGSLLADANLGCLTCDSRRTNVDVIASGREISTRIAAQSNVLLPEMFPFNAWKPSAMLSWPMVLLSSARRPSAVLLEPLVFEKSVSRPVAVLLLPVLFVKSAPAQVAFWSPPVRRLIQIRLAALIFAKNFASLSMLDWVHERPDDSGAAVIANRPAVREDRTMHDGQCLSAFDPRNKNLND
jgi:hypothetical protein